MRVERTFELKAEAETLAAFENGLKAENHTLVTGNDHPENALQIFCRLC
jgi:hypothetical protein